MAKIKPQTLKGFRDFLPEEMVIRQKVIDTLKEVFEVYGFQPLETPALEYAETLLGKSGEETDTLAYTFEDKGGRKIGLRYDLTVPVSRVLAQYRDKIPLPFKRYQIQTTWRAEKPQKGRYREFTQCDIDSFGSVSPLADAEIIAVIEGGLKKLGFDKFVIKINSRQVLFDLMRDLNLSQNKQLELLRSIDKLEKVGMEEVKKEFKEVGLTEKKIKKLFSLIKNAQPDKNLEQLFKYLNWLGVEEKYYQFEPTLARGLDYYTGPIFEAVVEKPKIGSIAGGGRYDNLIADLGGPNIPATGVSFGIDRICDVIKEQNLWPELSPTSTQVLVTIFSPELLEKSIEVTGKLRKANISTDLYLDPETKIDKQLKYADKKGIPYVIILGPEEIKKREVTLKNMKTGAQEKTSLENLIPKLTRVY
jgi:histidyl-tRNA synthetase